MKLFFKHFSAYDTGRKCSGLIAALVLSTMSLSFSAHGAEGEIHKDVIAALNWEVPENTCKKPRAVHVKVTSDPAADGNAEADVDTYTIKRYERKEKRWKSCVKKYKSGLMEDFASLKDSAKHGLTEPQAKAILANMSLLQSVYMTEGATLKEVAANAPKDKK